MAATTLKKPRKRFSVEGRLDEFAFPRVLQFLHEGDVTGRLVLRKGELTKVVFLVEGKPVNVDSTLRDETLGRYLVKKGKIAEKDFEKSIEVMIEQGMQQGAALVKLGCLSPRELYHEVKAQTLEKLLTCFAWTTGSFGFYPEVEFVEDIYRFEMSAPRLMKEGIVRFFPPGAVELQLAKVPKRPLLPAPNFINRIESFDLSEEESAFLFKIDGQRDLLSLKKEKDASPFVPKLLYLLLVCGLIGPEGKPEEALRSLGGRELVLPPIEDFMFPSPEDTAPEVVEEHLVGETPGPAPVPPPPPSDPDRGLSWETSVPETTDEAAAEEGEGGEGEEFSPELPAPEEEESSAGVAGEEEEPEALEPEVEAPTPPPGPIGARKELIEEEIMDDDDFKFTVPKGDQTLSVEEEIIDDPETPLVAAPKPAAAKAPSPHKEEPEEEETAPEIFRDEAEILEFYMGIKSADFFTLLHVPRTADDAKVLAAYRELRAEYDKTRFGPGLSSEASAKLEEIHAQIIRAYEALRTAEDRKQYLNQLDQRPAKPEVKPALQAEKFLQQGLEFVRKRDWASAQQRFEQAAAARPHEPEYHSYLGWTIYCNTALDLKMRREKAITLLRKAIEMNPQMDSPHVFLGKILKDDRKVGSAVEEFKRALRANPKCREAERELKARQKGEW